MDGDSSIAITTDPDLCRRVAEACGFRFCLDVNQDMETLDITGQWTSIWTGAQWDAFRPDVDMNHAFAAAEKAGLLTLNSLPRFGKYEGEYLVWCRSNDGTENCYHAGTPALAICHAILALKEKS